MALSQKQKQLIQTDFGFCLFVYKVNLLSRKHFAENQQILHYISLNMVNLTKMLNNRIITLFTKSVKNEKIHTI